MKGLETKTLVGRWAGKSSQGEQALPPFTSPQLIREDESFAQLNFKVPASMRRRVKRLAARDSTTLLAMLYHMVDLYEREHGALDR